MINKSKNIDLIILWFIDHIPTIKNVLRLPKSLNKLTKNLDIHFEYSLIEPNDIILDDQFIYIKNLSIYQGDSGSPLIARGKLFGLLLG